MNFQILHRPSYALLEVDLEPQQILVSESGAMVAKSKHVQIEPKLSTNPKASAVDKVTKIAIATIRKFVGGESFFVSHFTAQSPGKVWLAPTFDGDIVHYELKGEGIYLSSAAYLASVGDIDISVKWGGLRGLLSKEGLFYLYAKGTGQIWFNSFGGIEPIDVDGEYVIDNGHLVAWEPSLTYSIKRAGKGLTSMLASGEGLVCHFKGKGRVWIQTRNVSAYADWVNAFY